MPNLPAAVLTDFGAALLAAGGLSAEEARLVAESLVAANLRGHDSHGVMRIPS
ncbi:MAG TPA: Ldh family oxidoreductase, partial [Pirellulales bacterium]|nr:Ldh family oxidoreductase [Pirellulales bacterium]